MKRFKWFDWIIGLSPLIALLTYLLIDKPASKIILGIFIVGVIIHYNFRDYHQKKSNTQG
ncbi:MAG TPA: hypothetical protein VMV74_11225 [Bacteroidales bacterium]|nr:hypothetical protein [Bacteroidales bacterium]